MSIAALLLLTAEMTTHSIHGRIYEPYGPFALPGNNAINADVTLSGRVVDISPRTITIDTDFYEKQLMVTPLLASGQIEKPPVPAALHNFTDVKIEDKVVIDLRRTKGVDTCWAIGIHRRPGGRIPPGQDEFLAIRHHERLQAYQDWEEKGIPIPDRFIPVPPGMLSVPFPEVAPRPRPAIRTQPAVLPIPPAKP